jgi:GNAT superfamily N-acetyltransferase
MTESLRIIAEDKIDAQLDAIIRRNLCICFPWVKDTFERTRTWNECKPAWTVLIEQDQNVIAHAVVVDRTIRVGDTPVHVAGIGDVFVLHEHRRRGLSDRVLLAAMDRALAMRYDLGMLFCVPVLEKVYNRCGWITLDRSPAFFIDDKDQPQNAWASQDIGMFYPLATTTFPQGPINLQGRVW